MLNKFYYKLILLKAVWWLKDLIIKNLFKKFEISENWLIKFNNFIIEFNGSVAWFNKFLNKFLKYYRNEIVIMWSI